MSPIRIGVVGAGVFGRRHAGAIRSVPACELAAIADAAVHAVHEAARTGRAVAL